MSDHFAQAIDVSLSVNKTNTPVVCEKKVITARGLELLRSELTSVPWDIFESNFYSIDELSH